MLEFLMIGSRILTTGPGQVVFAAEASVTWVVPAGVTSISAVAIGRGNGAGGGGLSWRNNIPVQPSQRLTVNLSRISSEILNSQGVIQLIAMAGADQAGGYQFAGGGGAGGQNANAINGGGGNGGGGSNNDGYGGGAGGYSGTGGSASSAGITAGSGGGGAGGNPGGGVGLLGIGNSGVSFGQNGSILIPGQAAYGGGRSSGKLAIRIMWGTNRLYPSTNVLDQ